jgi:hypothetical protein
VLWLFWVLSSSITMQRGESQLFCASSCSDSLGSWQQLCACHVASQKHLLQPHSSPKLVCANIYIYYRIRTAHEHDCQQQSTTSSSAPFAAWRSPPASLRSALVDRLGSAVSSRKPCQGQGMKVAVVIWRIKAQVSHRVWAAQGRLCRAALNQDGGYLKRAADQATADREVSG